MSFTEILYEVEGAIATLTLNRPEQLNPMTRAIVAETVVALEEANADRSVRAVIVTGAGRAFSAGGDFLQLGAAGDYAAGLGDRRGAPAR